MREMEYQTQFDAVINMFAAFGYFTDAENTEILNRVAAALRPGGLFPAGFVQPGVDGAQQC